MKETNVSENFGKVSTKQLNISNALKEAHKKSTKRIKEEKKTLLELREEIRKKVEVENSYKSAPQDRTIKLKNVLIYHGLTQRDLAKKLGNDEGLISRWVNDDEKNYC